VCVDVDQVDNVKLMFSLVLHFAEPKECSEVQSVIQPMKYMQVGLSIIPNDKLLGDKDLQQEPLGRAGFGTVYKSTCRWRSN